MSIEKVSKFSSLCLFSAILFFPACNLQNNSSGSDSFLPLFIFFQNNSADKQNKTTGTAVVTVKIAAFAEYTYSSADVKKVRLSITGDGISVPVNQDLVFSGATWQGTIGELPEGEGRIFTARAFDVSGKLIFQGEVSGVRITSDGNPCNVAMLLHQTDDTPNDSNTAPIIDALTSSRAHVTPGIKVHLSVSAHDIDQGDTLSYLWTATGGSFSNSTVTNPHWTSPETEGVYTLSVRVTDSKGSHSSLDLNITVKKKCEKPAEKNSLPVISSINASPSVIDRGDFTRLTLDVSDADSDPLTFLWTSDCSGTFSDAKAQNPVFTADLNAKYETCTLNVAVDDGRNGTTEGSLALIISSSNEINLAPIIISSFQSALSVTAGGELIFRVEAKDPENSPLTFIWTSDTGILGSSLESGTANGTISQVTWTSPKSATISQISVTVSDSTGLSVKHDFLKVDVLSLISGNWSAGTDMNVARIVHTATILQDGRVLVVGGSDDSGYNLPYASAEIYNPNTGSWTVAAEMTTGRYWHTATLLLDGRVLVTGGDTNISLDSTTNSAEIYNPATDSWSSVPNMSISRNHHTATLLKNGSVLVAGGNLNYSSAEIYNPATNMWSSASFMNDIRLDHKDVLLNDGRVLIIGGYNATPGGSFLNTTEIYDPSTNIWTLTGEMNQGRVGHAADLLGNGHVLVTGGTTQLGESNRTEIFNPSSNSWSYAASFSDARDMHKSVLLSDGRVLIAGGANEFKILNSIEIYDPVLNSWSTADSMTFARFDHTLTLLQGGSVLITGGFYEINGYYTGPLKSVEIGNF